MPDLALLRPAWLPSGRKCVHHLFARSGESVSPHHTPHQRLPLSGPDSSQVKSNPRIIHRKSYSTSPVCLVLQSHLSQDDRQTSNRGYGCDFLLTGGRVSHMANVWIYVFAAFLPGLRARVQRSTAGYRSIAPMTALHSSFERNVNQQMPVHVDDSWTHQATPSHNDEISYFPLNIITVGFPNADSSLP